MAIVNPTDSLPGLAVPGLPPTMAPIPQVQPAAAYPIPRITPAPAPVPQGSVGNLIDQMRASGALAAYGVAPTAPAVPAAATPPAPATSAAAKPAAPATSSAAALPATAAASATPAPVAPAAATPAPITGLPTVAGSYPAGGNAVPVITPYTSSSGVALENPQSAIQAGFGLQDSRAQDAITQGINYVNQGGDIFDRATRGRFITGLLNAALGPNNAGSVAGAGANGFNSALAGIASSGIGAGASEYGAGLGYLGNQSRVGEANYEFNNQIAPIGTDIVQTTFGPMPVTRYGVRPGAAQPNAVTAAPQGPAAQPRVGMSYRGRDGTYNIGGGRTMTVKDGVVSEVQ